MPLGRRLNKSTISLLLLVLAHSIFTRAQQMQIPLLQHNIQESDNFSSQGLHIEHAPSANETISGGPAAKGYRSVVYFVNWAIYGRKHFPWELPVENLTHVLYAFANVRPESGEVYLTDKWADSEIHWDGDKWEDGHKLYGCLKQLNLLKRRNRNLKILLSIGGWTHSYNFKQPASTPEGRAHFAQTAVKILKNYGFDGLDLDWEYPQDASEAADLVALLKACREELDTYARTLAPGPSSTQDGPHHFELTVACPAGPQHYERLDLAGMDPYLDFWNLMAYDYAGSWNEVAGHQANLYPNGAQPRTTPFSTAKALEHYTRVVHPSKIVLGMPLYGRAFENTDGVGEPYSGVGEGSWDEGVYDFKELPLAGAEEVHDRDSGASYCYDPGRRTLVSYDTVPMARDKAAYIRDQGLGGAMWWESSADRQGGQGIIANVVDALGGPVALREDPNQLEYPESEWENLRDGFSG